MDLLQLITYLRLKGRVKEHKELYVEKDWQELGHQEFYVEILSRGYEAEIIYSTINNGNPKLISCTVTDCQFWSSYQEHSLPNIIKLLMNTHDT